MKLTLIEQWTRAWKFASVQIATIAAAIFAAGPYIIDTWRILPDSMRAALPEGMSRWVTVGAFILVVLGRVFKFEPKKEEEGAS